QSRMLPHRLDMLVRPDRVKAMCSLPISETASIFWNQGQTYLHGNSIAMLNSFCHINLHTAKPDLSLANDQDAEENLPAIHFHRQCDLITSPIAASLDGSVLHIIETVHLAIWPDD